MAPPKTPQGTITLEEDNYVSIEIQGQSVASPKPLILPHDEALEGKMYHWTFSSRFQHDSDGHCIKALRQRPPRTFEVFLTGGDVYSSRSATVRLSRGAVKRLPLIDDLLSVRVAFTASRLFLCACKACSSNCRHRNVVYLVTCDYKASVE